MPRSSPKANDSQDAQGQEPADALRLSAGSRILALVLLLLLLLASAAMLLLRGDGKGVHVRALPAAGGAALVAGEIDRQAVLPNAQLLRDPAGALRIEELTDPMHPSGANWRPMQDALLMAGMSRDTFWIRFTLRRTDQAQTMQLLVAGPTFLDDVRLYRPVGPSGPHTAGTWEELRAGDQVPVSQRPTRLREIVFPVHLSTQEHTYYLRVRSSSAMVLNLALWDPHAYVADAMTMNVHVGMLFGISAAGALMALLGWIWFRQGLFGIVAAYLLTFGLMSVIFGGYDQLWFYPERPWLAYHVSAVVGHLLSGLLILFSIAYLEPARFLPRYAALLRLLAWCLGLGAIFSALGQYALIDEIFYLVVLCMLPLLGALYLLMFRYDRQRALMMTLMFLPALVAGALHASRNLGFLPPGLWSGAFWNVATLVQAPVAIVVLLLRLVDAHRAMVRVRQRERLQRTFLDMIAHELRTPMSVISMALANIEARAQGLVPGIAPRIRRADAALARLGMLVDKALAAERLADANHGLDQRSVLPSELVVRFERALVVDPPHRLSVSRHGSDQSLSVDVAWVDVAVSNLVDNAVKYAPAGGEIRLQVERLPDRLRISVKDEGPGVPPQDQLRIFERFARGTGAGTAPAGTGLGLHLVRQIALRHGGTAGVDASDGGGAHFWIDLPAR